MARIRTIKPEFPHSESLGRVSRDARLLFVMLWTICDDEGRARANSRMLASLLFPYDDDATQHIPEWLIDLERENCIRVYAIDGNAYLHIVNWCVHQKIDKPSKSRLPAPPEKKNRRERAANIREPSREIIEASSEDLVPRTVDLGMEGTKQEEPPLTAAQPRRKPRFAIPADFPGENQRLFALKFWIDKGRPDLAHGYPDQRDQFRDHHAKEPTLSADWPATWRTWVRNAPKFSKENANGRAGRPTKSDNLRDGIAAFLAAGKSPEPAGDDHQGASRPSNGAAGCDLPPDGQRRLSHSVEIPDFLRRPR